MLSFPLNIVRRAVGDIWAGLTHPGGRDHTVSESLKTIGDYWGQYRCDTPRQGDVYAALLTNDSKHSHVVLTLAAMWANMHSGRLVMLAQSRAGKGMDAVGAAYGARKHVDDVSVLGTLWDWLCAATGGLVAFLDAYFDEKGDLQSEYDGLPWGDLIQDEYMELTGRVSLVRKDFSLLLVFIYAVFLHRRYERALRTPPQALVLHARCFVRFGLLARMAVKRGSVVVLPIYSNPVCVRVCRSMQDLTDNIRKVTPQDIEFARSLPEEQVGQDLDAYLAKRFSGNLLNDYDTRAFKGNSVSKTQLCSQLGLNPEKRLVLVMGHTFFHSVKYESWSVYKDFYTWLVETIKKVSQLPESNWVIKLHPEKRGRDHSKIMSLLKGMLEGVPHVKLLPDGSNTRELFELADGVVTCSGTAGLEGALLGIPAITCGDSAYYGLGVSLDAHTPEEYKINLERLSKGDVITNVPVARQIAFVHFLFFFNKTSLLSAELAVGEDVLCADNHAKQAACLKAMPDLLDDPLYKALGSDYRNERGVLLNRDYEPVEE